MTVQPTPDGLKVGDVVLVPAPTGALQLGRVTRVASPLEIALHSIAGTDLLTSARVRPGAAIRLDRLVVPSDARRAGERFVQNENVILEANGGLQLVRCNAATRDGQQRISVTEESADRPVVLTVGADELHRVDDVILRIDPLWEPDQAIR
jgi:hypothetical protein